MGRDPAVPQADTLRQHPVHVRQILPHRGADLDGRIGQEAGILGGPGRQSGEGVGRFRFGSD